MRLITYKKAGLKYEITDTIEAGIALFGFEVRSLREKKGSLDGSFASIRGGEAFLLNAYIPPYQPANTPDDYDPYRPRKLLLNKDELSRLAGEGQKGSKLTVVPISLYTKGRTIKVELALARGKKKYDKRESIKKKDTERDVLREFKKSIR